MQNRDYTQQDVEKLRGSLKIEHTLAKNGAIKFRKLLSKEKLVRALGAQTGMQAVQQVKAGLQSVYISGWQTASDANVDGQVYPDMSLYSVCSVPRLVKAVNNALQRADQIEWSENGRCKTDWFVPIIADCEAGFGGTLNVFELTKSMIEAGTAAIHLEDQLSSAKKCGHLGGKVLVTTSEMIRKLIAARLAADVCDVETVIIARTDANSAKLLTSDIDKADTYFIETTCNGLDCCEYDGTYDCCSPNRTAEGLFEITGGLNMAIARGLAYAPYCDMLWCETSKPDLQEAKQFADAIHAKFPDKWLCYNCSPSFNWSKNLTTQEIAEFQNKLSEFGFVWQFITLASFHAINKSMFELAHDYAANGMSAYQCLQDEEFLLAEHTNYSAVRHQKEAATSYFDLVSEIISGGNLSTSALKTSTEKEQF